MVLSTESVNVFNNVVTDFGVLCRLKSFSQSFSGALFDDSFVVASGTDAWFYGMPQPVSNKFGSVDQKFLHQGMIKLDDNKLFIPGSVTINAAVKYKVFIGGSPSITTPYEVLPEGVTAWNVSGVPVYQRVYLRLLNGGSFANEY